MIGNPTMNLKHFWWIGAEQHFVKIMVDMLAYQDRQIDLSSSSSSGHHFLRGILLPLLLRQHQLQSYRYLKFVITFTSGWSFGSASLSFFTLLSIASIEEWFEIRANNSDHHGQYLLWIEVSHPYTVPGYNVLFVCTVPACIITSIFYMSNVKYPWRRDSPPTVHPSIIHLIFHKPAPLLP